MDRKTKSPHSSWDTGWGVQCFRSTVIFSPTQADGRG